MTKEARIYSQKELLAFMLQCNRKTEPLFRFVSERLLWEDFVSVWLEREFRGTYNFLFPICTMDMYYLSENKVFVFPN